MKNVDNSLSSSNIVISSGCFVLFMLSQNAEVPQFINVVFPVH